MGDPVQDSSPLFIYSPPGAWIDTPLDLDDSPSLVRHASISLHMNRSLTIQFPVIPCHSYARRNGQA